MSGGDAPHAYPALMPAGVKVYDVPALSEEIDGA